MTTYPSRYVVECEGDTHALVTQEAAEKLIELGGIVTQKVTECCGAYCASAGCCPFINKLEE